MLLRGVFSTLWWLSCALSLRIFHVSLHDPHNVGDLYSSPLLYFPVLKNVTTLSICIDSDIPEVVSTHNDMSKGDVSIIGGGGLLDHSDRWNFALKHYCSVTTCILWAPGRNRHYSHSQRMFAHTSQEILDIAAAGSTRDFFLDEELSPLLDPSCMLDGLQTSPHTCTKTRNVGYYLHAKLAELKKEEVQSLLHGVDDEDILYNNEVDIDVVLKFLCQHQIIVTSSYHGVLWATYLDIPVYIVFDFSEKFVNLPFKVKHYPWSGDVTLSPIPYINGTYYRDKCIEENKKFYNDLIEPFVEILQQLAETRNIETDENSLIMSPDSHISSMFEISDVECFPFRRNHVYYSNLKEKTYEANVYIKIQKSLALYLLQFACEDLPTEEKPQVLVAIKKGHEEDFTSYADFTDYTISTVKYIKEMQEKPSFDYVARQLKSSVAIVLGLLHLEANIDYDVKLIIGEFSNKNVARFSCHD